eukprot:scaffold114125_cov29-Tisochrysis_lutea.AAC.2
MSVAVEGAKLKRSKSALPGQILFVLLFPLLMLQLAVSKMIGWKTVPFSWFAPGEGFSPTMDKGFGGFVASFTDPFTGEPVGQTPSEQQGQQEDEAQTGQGGVAERLELNTHCGSTSCPQFSGVCMLTQYIKWMLVVLFTPLIAIGYLFTLPLNLIVLGMRMAQPDGYDGKPAAVFGVVCFWLMSPVLFLELAIFALIGKKWPPLDIFISEGTDQPLCQPSHQGEDLGAMPRQEEQLGGPAASRVSRAAWSGGFPRNGRGRGRRTSRARVPRARSRVEDCAEDTAGMQAWERECPGGDPRFRRSGRGAGRRCCADRPSSPRAL